MRKLSLFVAILVAMFTTNIMAQTNYYVSHGANINISHGIHYPKAINIYGTESPVQLLDNIASAPGCAVITSPFLSTLIVTTTLPDFCTLY